jgi:hypothetical protein
VTYSDTTTASDCTQPGHVKETIVRHWTVTDSCGNSTTQDQTIKVVDTTPPTFTNFPADKTVECPGSTDPSAMGQPGGSDTCGTTTVTYTDTPTASDCTQPGHVKEMIVRHWTVTDACGNSTTQDQTIKVVDTTPPVISCPADKQLQCGESSDPANTGTASAKDNCGDTPTITRSDAATAANCTGHAGIDRTWTATDSCGNTASCVQHITFADTTPPMITCPPDVTIACDASILPANTGSATATDNCGQPVITFSDATMNNCPNNLSVITRTWTATDGCGNASTCFQHIYVQCCVAHCPPASSAISSGFNGTSINTANYIWFNANFNASGIAATGTTIFFKNSVITIASAQGNFTYAVPDGRVVFSRSATCATTTFNSSGWVTTVPLAGSDEILLSALGIKAPADLKAASVTWSGYFSASTPGVSISWKWGAAVYTKDMTQAQNNALGVKPTHTGACLYNNSDHAGTPENMKTYVIGGARGGGGSNWTGSWSGTASAKLCQ